MVEMSSYDLLIEKLEAFIRRFYLNELLKGGILFLSLGLFYFLFTLLIEYFLWLEPSGRQFLFWSFIAVEAGLLVKFIILPLLKLFKLSKGLDFTEASKIIGRHFPEVNDKLLNVLQLKQNAHQSELLLAGIDQKANELQPVPFRLAVNFKANVSFLKYLAVPALVIALVFASGNANLFAESYKRVVDYKTEYLPPAAFRFEVIPDLRVQENENFKLQVKTIGKIIPENVSINYNGQTYFLKKLPNGIFEYDFEPLKESTEFVVSANEIVSGKYKLEVIEVPKMTNFRMILDYPNYTGMKDEVQSGSGNATFPEGTHVKWLINAVATSEVEIKMEDSLWIFKNDKNEYFFEKSVYENVDYEVSTSNSEVKNHEKLAYSLQVVKDQYPKLELQSKKDSLGNDLLHFYGKISDDYGFSALSLKFYPEDDPKMVKSIEIPISKGNLDEFFLTFPENIELKKGKNYQLFFELVDNDALRKGKSVKSRIFDFRKKTDEEIIEEKLEQQKEAIEGIDNSLEKMEKAEEELEEFSRLQKEKGNLDYNDQKKLENFLQRQRQQNEIMEQHTEKLKEGLQEVEKSTEDEFRQQLEERIQKREEHLEENEELLKELQEYSDKIKSEELAEKLEELSRQNLNQEKNLEQLLELTKRYYVQQKANKIAEGLQELGEEQMQLSEKPEKNSKEKQDALNTEFQEMQEEMRNLEEENRKLKKPMELGQEKTLEKEISDQQKKATENLEQDKKKDAQENQKRAAERMKELSKKMKQQQKMAAGKQMQEDVEMLRQILDNLLIFSFEQEDLLQVSKEMNSENPSLAGTLRKQNLLKEHFEHVNDSLYALALRNPMLTEKVTEKLTDITFNLEKALERFAQKEIPQGVGSQQYVITGANDLAYFLSQIFDNMQEMLNPSSGSGSGDTEIQLPDIIKKQSELNQKMREGLEKQEEEGMKQEGKQNIGGKEGESERIYEIYKQQQILRQALQEKLREEGMGSSGDFVKKEMEKIEQQILEKGYNQESLNRMLQLEHKLLDLEDAMLRQGKKRKRESNFSDADFEKEVKDQKLKAKEYFNTTEILNRQSLPLRQIYKQKVQEYFERRNP
ncbi:MAG TPA: hypothetical protein VFM59_03010 [Salinimicrobium sp.]|nr:hypothetical protein [Salinimicrobium sp.]